MVKFKLKIHQKQRLMYVPKELFEILGIEPIAIPNAFSILIFKKDEDIDKVIASVKIILQDLELRQESQDSLEQPIEA